MGGIAPAAVGWHVRLPSRPSHLPGVAPLGVLSAVFFSLLLLLYLVYSHFCLPTSAVARSLPSLWARATSRALRPARPAGLVRTLLNCANWHTRQHIDSA